MISAIWEFERRNRKGNRKAINLKENASKDQHLNRPRLIINTADCQFSNLASLYDPKKQFLIRSRRRLDTPTVVRRKMPANFLTGKPSVGHLFFGENDRR